MFDLIFKLTGRLNLRDYKTSVLLRKWIGGGGNCARSWRTKEIFRQHMKFLAWCWHYLTKAFFLPVTASSADVTPSSDVVFLSLFFKSMMIGPTGKKRLDVCRSLARAWYAALPARSRGQMELILETKIGVAFGAPPLGTALVINFGYVEMSGRNPTGLFVPKFAEMEMIIKAVPNYRAPKLRALSYYP